MGKKNTIMVLGLNPALQKLIFFPDFFPNRVNRAEKISYISGGKGANFAKAVLNYGSYAKVFQFSGGSSGKKYCEIIELEKIPYLNQTSSSETRICSTLISERKQQITEIIEPSGTILEKEAKKLLAQCISSLPKFQGVAICGTFPPGIKAKFYAKLAHQAQKNGKPVLMDSYLDVIPVLKEGVDILKINLSELKQLTGKRKASTAAKAVFKDFPIKIIAVTDGPNNANLFLKQDTNISDSYFTQYDYSIPKLKKVINPIGAGDVVSAVLFAEYLKKTPIHEAFKLALGAGSASCITSHNAVFDNRYARKLAESEIKLTQK